MPGLAPLLGVVFKSVIPDQSQPVGWGCFTQATMLKQRGGDIPAVSSSLPPVAETVLREWQSNDVVFTGQKNDLILNFGSILIVMRRPKRFVLKENFIL